MEEMKRARSEDQDEAPATVQPVEGVKKARSEESGSSLAQAPTTLEKPVEVEGEVKKPRTHRKRRICVLYGYLGKGYHGSMKGGGELPTLEGEVETALQKAGYITDDLKRLSMSRSSRTDKGVSALVNAFGAQLYISQAEIDNRSLWIDRVNSFLPDTIRVWHAFRVRGSFSAKDAPCSRTYDYVAPVFCFKPASHDASVPWEFDDSALEHINALLLYFLGTQNYHNYTNGKNFDSKEAKRVILSFKAMTKVYIDGAEFVHFRIKGQSFMLHQIRKMMCMVMHAARAGFLGQDSARRLIQGSFGRPHINIMKAPAQGLFLKEVHFDIYNQHWGTGEGRDSVLLDPLLEPQVEAFAQRVIWPEISREKEEFENFLIDMAEYPMEYESVMTTCDEMEAQAIQREAERAAERGAMGNEELSRRTVSHFQ